MTNFIEYYKKEIMQIRLGFKKHQTLKEFADELLEKQKIEQTFTATSDLEVVLEYYEMIELIEKELL
jgi:hypothetical protein